MSEALKTAAFQYWQKGCRIVPLIDKLPLVKWEQWERENQSLQDFENSPWDRASAFAVVCGIKLTNDLYVGVLDLDVEKAGKPLPQEVLEKQGQVTSDMPVTQLEETPSGGKHLVYYSKAPVQTKTYEPCGIEVLGEGKLCILAPSKGYVKSNDNLPSEVPDLNCKFEEALKKAGFEPKVQPTREKKGKRKAKQVRHCCEVALLRDKHVSHLMRLTIAAEYKKLGWADDDIVDLFRSQADFDKEKCLVQVGSADADKAATCESIEEWGYCYPDCPLQESGKDLSQADKLVALCLSENPTLFHDQHKTPYIRVRQANINVIMPIRCRQFKSWLANLMWQTEQKVPGTEGLSSSINVLQGKAVLEGKQYTLYNRVAPDPEGNGFWLDMTDEKWRAIHVNAEGWKIIDDPPILFRRYSHQLPLAEPKTGGDPWKLLSYLNIDEKDEGTRLSLIVACASYYIPLIPHPILVLYGIQGSGKTWVFVILRRVFDPSSIDVLSMPRDEREHVQQLEHHWLAFYDNMTSLPTWISDRLCRAATGGGFTKRELYSDDEDVIYNFKRCVGLNGINIAAQRGDLLDRSLLVGLQNIPKEKRRTEEHLSQEFEACRAEILGGFLDTLVKALQIYPSVNPKGLFRLADFTRWGCAIAVALGKTQQDFLDAYEVKVKTQIEEAAQSSVVATVLLDYMEHLEDQTWEGSPTQLFSCLLNHAKALGISTHQKAWPKAPNVLLRQLNELASSLQALDLGISTSKSGDTKTITVTQRRGENIVPTVPTVPTDPKHGPKNGDRDDRDDRDDIITSSLGGSLREKLEAIRTWLVTNKDQDSLIDAAALAIKCKQLDVDIQKTAKILLDEYCIFEVPQIGKWGVK